jgi:hypothetical protein
MINDFVLITDLSIFRSPFCLFSGNYLSRCFLSSSLTNTCRAPKLSRYSTDSIFDYVPQNSYKDLEKKSYKFKKNVKSPILFLPDKEAADQNLIKLMAPLAAISTEQSENSIELKIDDNATFTVMCDAEQMRKIASVPVGTLILVQGSLRHEENGRIVDCQKLFSLGSLFK